MNQPINTYKLLLKNKNKYNKTKNTPFIYIIILEFLQYHFKK